MGWPASMTEWTGAAFAVLAIGCAGAEPPAEGRPEVGSPTRSPALAQAAHMVTVIEPAKVVNRRPRFISLAPGAAQEGEPYRYLFSALDPDGEEVTYRLLRAPEGASVEGRVLRWTPRHAQVGRPQRFTLRAVDERGAARDQTWSVTPRIEPGAGHRLGSGQRF